MTDPSPTVTYDIIPQAALSSPETREAAQAVLCTVCGGEVCMIDRTEHPKHPKC